MSHEIETWRKRAELMRIAAKRARLEADSFEVSAQIADKMVEKLSADAAKPE